MNIIGCIKVVCKTTRREVGHWFDQWDDKGFA